MANFLVWVVWCVAAFACLASALAVVSFSNPFYSALSLIGNLASLAVLFLLLCGEFVAAGQVLVYGGAVMVMFLFVIAYLGDRTDESPWSGGPSWQIVGAVARGRRDPRRGVRRVGLEAGGCLTEPQHIDRSFGITRLDRATVPDRPPDRVRGDVDRAARRRRRRRRARLAAQRRIERRCTGLTPRGTSLLSALLFVDRRARRAAAAQPADHPALGRDHAQRREPRPDRVLAPARAARTARSSRSR